MWLCLAMVLLSDCFDLLCGHYLPGDLNGEINGNHL